MEFTQTEKDMARKGYVYFARTVGSGKRNVVKDLTGMKRSDLIFDLPAYEAKHDPR